MFLLIQDLRTPNDSLIGLKSGEYDGKNSTYILAASYTSSNCLFLWIDVLSMMITDLEPGQGKQYSSTMVLIHSLKISVVIELCIIIVPSRYPLIVYVGRILHHSD